MSAEELRKAVDGSRGGSVTYTVSPKPAMPNGRPKSVSLHYESGRPNGRSLRRTPTIDVVEGLVRAGKIGSRGARFLRGLGGPLGFVASIALPELIDYLIQQGRE